MADHRSSDATWNDVDCRTARACPRRSGTGAVALICADPAWAVAASRSARQYATVRARRVSFDDRAGLRRREGPRRHSPLSQPARRALRGIGGRASTGTDAAVAEAIVDFEDEPRSPTFYDRPAAGQPVRSDGRHGASRCEVSGAVRIIERAAGAHPCVLLVEDIHWASRG